MPEACRSLRRKWPNIVCSQWTIAECVCYVKSVINQNGAVFSSIVFL